MPRFIMVGESRQSVNTPNVFAAQSTTARLLADTAGLLATAARGSLRLCVVGAIEQHGHISTDVDMRFVTAPACSH